MLVLPHAPNDAAAIRCSGGRLVGGEEGARKLSTALSGDHNARLLVRGYRMYFPMGRTTCQPTKHLNLSGANRYLF